MNIRSPIIVAGLLAWWGGLTASRADVIGVNLLTNSDLTASNMNGWTVTANGGDGWAVNAGVFYTSHEWDIRSQTVDLLAKGLTTAELEASPDIRVGVYKNTYWGGLYFLDVSLQDAGHTVITNFQLGSQSDPIVEGSSFNWNYDWVGTTFSDYASGVRYVVYTDGGQDNRGWAGHYGTSFELAEVTVVPEPHILGLFLLAVALAWYYRKWSRLARSAQPARWQ